MRETDADFFGGEKVGILEELGCKRFSEFPEEVSQQRGKAVGEGREGAACRAHGDIDAFLPQQELPSGGRNQ